MAEPRIRFDHVWKKFQRGEPHDSLRDLIPALVTSMFGRRDAQALDGEEFWALRDVSFEVQPGETLGIIGRNGAGKSTTLKLLTRIIKPTKGRSEVHGRVGALIELAAGFHPDLTGRENVFLQGAIMGMRRHEILRRFDEIVEFAGISEFIDTQVKRYSSGMQARLGFSVAAHLNPDVLLIDEVLAVGDLSFQQKCYERLREFKRTGIAIAFVSHNMQAISLLSDRVLYLRPNASPLCGSVGDMITKYVTSDTISADARVAFEGSTLCIDGSDEPVTEPIPPKTWLALEVRVRAVEALPKTAVALIVHRSDGLVVFNGSSLLDGVPPVNLAAGDLGRFRLKFRTNLTRGTYAVSIQLFEEQRKWPAIDLGIAGSFVVHESTRAAGITELEPQYELEVEPRGRRAHAGGERSR